MNGRKHWASRVVIDPLELVILGARMADPKFKELAGNDLFSGDLSNVVNAVPGKQSAELWKWLKMKGVERQGEEKPLDAIVRTLSENRDRRSHVREIMSAVNSLKPGEITRGQLLEIRDKLYGREELVPNPDIAGLADPMAKLPQGERDPERGSNVGK